MLQFSNRLSHNGISITLALTNYLSKTTELSPSSISVETISDGYDDGGSGDTSLDDYGAKFEKVGQITLTELLNKLNTSGQPVDCIIYDPFLPWSVLVAKKFGIIGASFFTQSCGVNNIYYSLCKGEIQVPLVDKEYFVPGLPLLRPGDFPSFVYDPERHPGALGLLRDQFLNVEEADYVFVNSIYEFEKEAYDWMANFVNVKTIGPTIPSMYLDNKRLKDEKDYGLSNLNPVSDCIEWLNEKPSRTVIYAAFGSMATLKPEEMNELALGLKLSSYYFLWVVRSSEESKLPQHFAEETSNKGIIVSWCPQLEVLQHKAISCFLTHCGWNSTLEALSLGVPMVGVPWWSDQSTNAKLVIDCWKTGLRARPDTENIVRHGEILHCLKGVMEGDEGEEMRNHARKWREVARRAVQKGGSSDVNIKEFISRLASLTQKN